MKTDNGESVSVWMTTPDTRVDGKLTTNLDADVCIVGAGITGMTTAYLLSLEKQRVVVLDDGPVAGGETCRTTAHLVNAPDARFTEIERLHGKEAARVAADSHTAAIDRIEEIVRREEIRCGFLRLDGYLFTEPGDSAESLEKELVATHSAGLSDVELVDRVPIDSFQTGAALRFPRQAQFHVLEYISRSLKNSSGPRAWVLRRPDEERGGRRC
ncbi:MAG: NAD(P)/FAD-dependent oxidoreductase [Gemmatimonadota bacterium]